MPRPRGFGKGETARANVRLDPDTLAFYKARANESGVSLSEYLRQTLTQGVITENVTAIEARLRVAGDEMQGDCMKQAARTVVRSGTT